MQSKHWPKLVQAGLLPEISDDVITAMVEDFKHRHRTGHVDPEPLRRFLKYCSKLGGDYNRYSCDNSNPKSIIDQMVNGLEKGRQEERFIPWQYVFADYSVSGLNASRQGYTSYKAVLQSKDHFIEVTFIDDFTRASRDEVEWWRLAYLSRRLQKRMIGASDGFDLSSPNWDMTISVYGLLSRLFIKGLREKVKRGMRGAARRGSSLGKPPLGFTRTVRRDEQGNIVRDKDGVPEYVPCIDPATRDFRKLMYELFVDKRWSTYAITKRFNALKVDDWEGWTDQGIKKLLWSPSAIGVFMWNKTRREYDHEEEKWIVVQNPRKDWDVYYDPDLEIVPIPLWKAARKRLAAMRRKSPLTGRKMSRNEKSAKTLFSGTLFCGYCEQEIKLFRSTSKYKVLGCFNGAFGKHSCKLSSSKATRIIEECLLGFLQDRLLTEKAVEGLVAKANAYLGEEASKPRLNTAPLKASVRDKEATIKKLFPRIEGCQDEALVQAYEKRISELQKEVNQVKEQLRAAEVHNEPPPVPLELAAVKALLPDLRGLLNQEIPAAAEAIRALTGPITIRQEEIPGKKRGAKWIATFSPDLPRFLRRAAKEKDCPESITLEYLNRGTWITPQEVSVTLEHKPKYERIAAEVAAMLARGASVVTTARALGHTEETVEQAREFAKTGQRPKTKPPGRRTGTRSGTPRYIELADEVVRLRDQEHLSWPRIAKITGVSPRTVRRAYDHGRPEVAREAAEKGQRPRRGRDSHLGPEVYERIRAALNAGERPRDIARAVGCSAQTVRRVRRTMRCSGKDGSGSGPAA